MNREQLWHAIGEADDVYLKECDSPAAVLCKPNGIGRTLISAASLVIIFGTMLILPKLLFGGSWGGPADTGAVSDTAEASTDDTEDTVPDTTVHEAYRKEYISNHGGVLLSFPISVSEENFILFQQDPEDPMTSGLLHQIFYHAENGSFDGEILRIYKYTAGEYERNVLANFTTPTYPLGTDGEYYYVMTVPTDVSIDPSDKLGIETAAIWREHVLTYFSADNGLTLLDKTEFQSREFTYESEHKYVRYYPYGTETDFFYTLVLSQPAEQGNDGIWCVERWYDMNKAISTPLAGDTSEPSVRITGYIHIAFPDSGELSAKEYYAAIHEKVWKGQTAVPAKYLDPVLCAIVFVREELGVENADASLFVEADGIPEGDYTY